VQKWACASICGIIFQAQLASQPLTLTIFKSKKFLLRTLLRNPCRTNT